MDAGCADLDETKRRMKGIRCRVWRNLVDLADYAVMPDADSVLEQAVIEPSRATAPTC